MTSRIVARHRTQVLGKDIRFDIVAPPGMDRREVGDAIATAVAELRAVDAAFSPFRPRSLVSAVRRGELSADGYPPPLAEVVRRCAALRAATDGWFDAWAVPGGFDPSGIVKGWAVDRAAALLNSCGIAEITICAGADRLVQQSGAVPEAFAVAGSAYHEVVDPHTGLPSLPVGLAAVTGPELGTANGYAIALCAAGESGLAWFPTADGYRAVFAGSRPFAGSNYLPAA
jgi:FAD:protein FMN transferase